jgi:hypothetical protein
LIRCHGMFGACRGVGRDERDAMLGSFPCPSWQRQSGWRHPTQHQTKQQPGRTERRTIAAPVLSCPRAPRRIHSGPFRARAHQTRRQQGTSNGNRLARPSRQPAAPTPRHAPAAFEKGDARADRAGGSGPGAALSVSGWQRVIKST